MLLALVFLFAAVIQAREAEIAAKAAGKAVLVAQAGYVAVECSKNVVDMRRKADAGEKVPEALWNKVKLCSTDLLVGKDNSKTTKACFRRSGEDDKEASNKALRCVTGAGSIAKALVEDLPAAIMKGSYACLKENSCKAKIGPGLEKKGVALKGWNKETIDAFYAQYKNSGERKSYCSSSSSAKSECQLEDKAMKTGSTKAYEKLNEDHKLVKFVKDAGKSMGDSMYKLFEQGKEARLQFLYKAHGGKAKYEAYKAEKDALDKKVQEVRERRVDLVKQGASNVAKAAAAGAALAGKAYVDAHIAVGKAAIKGAGHVIDFHKKAGKQFIDLHVDAVKATGKALKIGYENAKKAGEAYVDRKVEQAKKAGEILKKGGKAYVDAHIAVGKAAIKGAGHVIDFHKKAGKQFIDLHVDAAKATGKALKKAGKAYIEHKKRQVKQAGVLLKKGGELLKKGGKAYVDAHVAVGKAVISGAKKAGKAYVDAHVAVGKAVINGGRKVVKFHVDAAKATGKVLKKAGKAYIEHKKRQVKQAGELLKKGGELLKKGGKAYVKAHVAVGKAVINGAKKAGKAYVDAHVAVGKAVVNGAKKAGKAYVKMHVNAAKATYDGVKSIYNKLRRPRKGETCLSSKGRCSTGCPGSRKIGGYMTCSGSGVYCCKPVKKLRRKSSLKKRFVPTKSPKSCGKNGCSISRGSKSVKKTSSAKKSTSKKVTCKSGKRAGVCQSVSSCGSGLVVAGLCPGASSIKCCLNK